MKSFLSSTVVVLMSVGPLAAAVINDGTTTIGLARRANDAAPISPATNWISTAGDGSLVVRAQASAFSFPSLRTVWYAQAIVPTGGTYTVSADFRPDLPTQDPYGSARQGGVTGWVNLRAGDAVACYVKPAGDDVGFYVAHLDLVASVASTAHLFNTNGVAVPASDLGVKSTVAAAYSATNFVTFELAFSAPTTEDLMALSNATARITARVWQGNGATRAQVSDTLELLTDLALPAEGEHFVGYHAVWGDLPFEDIDATVGFLDNLQIEGQFGVGNLPPQVRLTSPVDGRTFGALATIDLAVDASDADGTLARVEYYYNGTNLVASSTTAPSFQAQWSGVDVGNYQITAVAYDNRNASTVSAPVGVTVTQSTTPPPLRINLSGNEIVVRWDGTGFQLEFTLDLGTTWTAVSTTGTEYREPAATAARKFFRLKGSGLPPGPRLVVSLSGQEVVISWDQDGYLLEAASDLGTSTWLPVPTTGREHREPVSTAPRRFFRLKK